MAEKKIPIEDPEVMNSNESSSGKGVTDKHQHATSEQGAQSATNDTEQEKSTEVQSGEHEEDGSTGPFSFFGKKGGEKTVPESSLKEAQEKYIRALADFENFKKRSVKERSDLLKYQGERVFIDLLEVVDNLDRAIEAADSYELTEDGQRLREGVALIHRMFLQVLKKWDVRGEAAIGETFDPQKHEAISQMPSSEFAAGVVMNELEKTYFYKDKLIRPGKVVVAMAPTAPQGEELTAESASEGSAGEAEE